MQLKGSFANPGTRCGRASTSTCGSCWRHDPHALTVPAAAVQRSQDGAFVCVVDADGKAAQASRCGVGPIQDGIAVIEQRACAPASASSSTASTSCEPGVAVVESARRARGRAARQRGVASRLASTGVASPLATAHGSRQ